jgi:uncharacterized protein
MVYELSRRDARRLAIRAQWLDADRPRDLLALVRRLTLLQLDPVSAVAPSAHLVAWSRLGSAYRRADLDTAVAEHALIELQAMLRPAEDIALYRAQLAAWPGGDDGSDWRRQRAAWLRANDGCRRDILHRLEADGPLPSRELPDTCVVPWVSTGWTNNKNVTKMLDLLVASGEVAVAGRLGRERLWDLAQRVYPDEPVVPEPEATRRRNARRLQSLGIARTRAERTPVEPREVTGVGADAVVEGVRGRWVIDPSYLDLPFTGRTALLSPFDRLLHNRRATLELFDFDYQLEMYKPVAKRRWGYYALPILHGDALVGKLDATADTAAGVLRVSAIHWDAPSSTELEAAVEREIAALASWLELDLQVPDRRP